MSEYEPKPELERLHDLNRSYTHDINVLEAKVAELTEQLRQANDKIAELL